MEQPEQEHIPGRGARLLKMVLRETVITIIPTLVLFLFVNVFIAEATEVKEGPSMQPNVYRGDRVMTEKISYRFHLPRRGDVVIADRPQGEIALIKRVVGLPGDTVEVRSGHVYINGTPISEPWVAYWGGPDYPPTVVPAGHVFILGDNRANSRDSRSIGPVPASTIEGRVLFIYWPLNHIGPVR